MDNPSIGELQRRSDQDDRTSQGSENARDPAAIYAVVAQEKPVPFFIQQKCEP